MGSCLCCVEDLGDYELSPRGSTPRSARQLSGRRLFSDVALTPLEGTFDSSEQCLVHTSLSRFEASPLLSFCSFAVLSFAFSPGGLNVGTRLASCILCILVYLLRQPPPQISIASLVCTLLVTSFALSPAWLDVEPCLAGCILFAVGFLLRPSKSEASPALRKSESNGETNGVMKYQLESSEIPYTLTEGGISLSFRVSDEEAANIRARGGDPYIAQRLNYLQGTTVPFGPLFLSLNARERKAFETFQSNFPQKLDADERLDRRKFYQTPDRFTMLLFLQADNYKVDLAIARLVNTIIWRQQSKLDDFVDNPDMKLYNRYLTYRAKLMIGFDRLGRPLLVERLGEFFGSDNGEQALTRDEWSICSSFELTLVGAAFRASSVHHNRPIHRLVYIGDMLSLRFRQAKNTMPYLKFISNCVEEYFPETAGPVYLINAPFFLEFLLKVAYLFLPKTVVANTTVKSGPQPELLCEQIGASLVPREYGGDLDYSIPHIPPLDT